MGTKTKARRGLELGTRTRSAAATVRTRSDDYYVDGERRHDEKKTKKRNQNKNKRKEEIEKFG